VGGGHKSGVGDGQDTGVSGGHATWNIHNTNIFF